jgi:ABC-type transport system involved in cytochrome c biogenesis permease subunit
MARAKLVSWGVGVAAVLAVLAGALRPGPVRGFDLATFGTLPVLEGGRVKPIDSLARNALLVIRSKQSVPFEGRNVGPDEWLLDVMFRPEVADKQPVFVVDDPEVLGLMGLPQSANRYRTFDELKPHLEAIQAQGGAAHRIDTKLRTRFQTAIVSLYNRLWLYYRIKNTMQIDTSGGLDRMLAALDRPELEPMLTEMVGLAYFRALPPSGPGAPWQSTAESMRALKSGGPRDGALEAFAALGKAWAAQDAAAFDGALPALRLRAATGARDELGVSDAETVFNRVQPFYAGMVVYVLALLVLFASWLWRREWLSETAFALLAAGALVHTAGLVARVALQGRPPVTNLYSSAIFVGWGAVLLGTVLERVYRKGFGTAVAASAGFASLLVAHHLAGDGDTMEMMRAVLDSNFWLATHVVTITIGYSGTFLAGGIAIAYALRNQFSARLEPETTRALSAMTYGVVAFSLLFSFVGTVLGGIWADQSWGRFWGWDPKENGALLIVLWNAIILHARWGGFVRERGVMAMAIFGNVITSLSWFGVNMLGVGLHSYGFMDSAFWALTLFCASQLSLMALCLAPRHFWRATSASEPPSGVP